MNDFFGLREKRVLVTGAHGGLARVFVRLFAELGAELILVDKDPDLLKAISLEISNEFGTKVSYFSCDFEDERQITDLIEWAKVSFGDIGVLINNAAFTGATDIDGWIGNFESQSIGTYRRALEVNLNAPFHLCRGLYALLERAIDPCIINVSSIYGFKAPEWQMYDGIDRMGNPAAYASSKGGLIQLTRWLASTLAPKIRVNAISPGGIFNGQSKEFIDRYIKLTPMKRMASYEDIGKVIVFLASDMSLYITGQNIVVDGGFTI